jgi:hypothetical protein
MSTNALSRVRCSPIAIVWFAVVLGALLVLSNQVRILPRQTQAADDLRQFPNEEFNASIVQVLAHRDKYHGKRVQLAGYLHVRFERTAIYLSKEDAEFGMTRNGFWVTFDKKAVPHDNVAGPVQFDGKYVLIEGSFNKNSMGHMSAWQGTIERVDQIMELRRNE